MKIRDASVIVTSPGRNFVTLKVTTDDGATGLGGATLNGRELAVASAETAGFYNTVGFTDDTRAFSSIPCGRTWRGGSTAVSLPGSSPRAG